MNGRDENKMVKLTIFRFNPEKDREPKYETYEAEWVPSLNAHMALTYINKHNRANIAFRRGCREAGCGACTIMVNGIPELACRAVVKDGDVLEPLKGYPIIRDLVVERTPQTTEMFRKIKYGREGKPIGFVPAKPESMSISRALTICTDCHGCNTICPPWLEAPEAFVGPMYMLNVIRAMFNPLEEYDRVNQAIQMGLYNCTMCRACTVSCPKDIEISENIIRARERAAESNGVPEEVKKICKNIMETNNIYGEKKDKLVSWATPLGIPKQGKTVFFSSCEYLATEEGKRILSLMDKLINKIGIKISYLYEEEPCCGGPLYFYGFHDKFKEKVSKTYKLFKERGIEEIITSSPICTYTLKELYPKYIEDFNIRVRNIIEILFENIKSKTILPKLAKNKKIIYHDSPFLSRYLNISNEPREIIKSIPGATLLEPKYYSGINTMGDGYFGISPEIKNKIAEKRLIQLRETGAEVIITASAFDLFSFREATKNLGEKDIEVIDIVELLAQSMEVR